MGFEKFPRIDRRETLQADVCLECFRFMMNFPIFSDATFTQLVKEVSHVLRKQMGFDFYQERYASQLTDRARLKAKMKQRRAVERMLDPEMDLERREKRRKAEKDNKKLKRRGLVSVKSS